MSIYYIKNEKDGNIFTLDSTSDMEIMDNGSATSIPIESGKPVSDHYVNDNVTIRFNGTISDVKAISVDGDNRIKSTQLFLEGLRSLKASGLPFTIHTGANSGLFENCVLESLAIKQSNKNGTLVRGDKEISSYKISFTAKQIRFGSRADLVRVTDEVIEKTVGEEREKAGGKKSTELLKVGDKYIPFDQVPASARWRELAETTFGFRFFTNFGKI